MYARMEHDIAWFIRLLMEMQENANVFCPYSCAGDGFEILTGDRTRCKLTAITDQREFKEAFEAAPLNDKHNLYLGATQYFSVHEQFHYAFCQPPLRYSIAEDGTHHVAGIQVNDVLRDFECSRDPHSDERVGMLHLIALESMEKAVHYGGLFCAVLPKGWMGDHSNIRMRYVNWFNNHIPTVAKIALPHGAVYYLDENGDKQPINIKHELCCFAKPLTHKLDAQGRGPLGFARFTHSMFTYKLDGLAEGDGTNLGIKYSGTDWYKLYVTFLAKFYRGNNTKLRLTPSGAAVRLSDPSQTIVFEPKPEHRLQFKVATTKDEIRSNLLGVHIKPGNKVKLVTYSPVAEGLLHELRVAGGKNPEFGKTSDYYWLWDQAMSVKVFHRDRDELCMNLISAGLTPYLLASDVQRLNKQEKWAERQLTPIERCVKTSREGEPEQWELQFEEIGVRAMYPELLEQWRVRATKMKLHKLLYPFQFNGVLIMAVKDSCLDADMMGLGKTLSVLALALLLTTKKILLVVPSKLIGEWQNEIERMLASFCRNTRLNWRGESIRDAAKYQIIQWAADCKPENLKAINIIAYEKLTRQPKDAHYFFCPACSTTACSMKFVMQMPCPKCNHGVRKKWRRECVAAGERKTYIGKGRGQFFRGNYTVTPGQTMEDNRSPMPDLVMMKRSKHILKKVKKVQVGFKAEHRPVNGEIVKVQVPLYESVPKVRHMKWTFANLLRNRFNLIGLDEAEYIKNAKTARTHAVSHLRARRKVPCTGTPIRGFAESILNMLNWMLKPVIFPEYRYTTDRSGLKRFNDKYETTVINQQTGKKKKIPKILNPEQFQAEMAPFILRRHRNEPEVIAVLSRKDVIVQPISLDMDDEHRAYYELWLEKFKAWWQKMKEEEEGRKVKPGELMVKMGYLVNASTQPRWMLHNILKGKDEQAKEWAREIGLYKGGATSKQRKVFQLCEDVANSGDKGIVFSDRRNNLLFGMTWCANHRPRIAALQIDGKVSRDIKAGGRSQRQQMVNDFREGPYSILWAGLKSMRDGANIPEANHGIFMDLSWVPSDLEQAAHRMIRPQQKKTVFIKHLVHLGTIDDYMRLWCTLKAHCADEGIDFMEFDDFSSKMIPDINQYANAIVDGTESIVRAEMELAIEHIRKQQERGHDDSKL